MAELSRSALPSTGKPPTAPFPHAMASAALPPSRRLPFLTKAAYGFGSIAYGVKDNGFSTLLLLFYNQVIGLPAQLVGLAIMIALVLDAVVDPVIGHFSDHLTSRWGRRHPFMYASAAPVGALYLLLWNPPAHASPLVDTLYLVGIAILVRTAISAYEVPSAALAPELTADYHERTSVLGYRFVFGWIGGMGMLLLTFLVFLAPTAHYPVGQLNPEGYRRYAIVAACLMTGAILISAGATHREIKHLVKPNRTKTSLGDTLRGVIAAFRNRAFLVLMISGVFSYTNQGLNFALNTYFNTFLWGFPAAALAVFTVAVLIGVTLAFALASRASRRWGKRNVTVVCSVAYTVVAAAPLMLRLIGVFPANGTPWLLPILMATATLATTLGVAGAILGSSMMSDVVEDAQTRSHTRDEGLFFAGSFFMQKCVSGFGLFLSGGVLALAHFPVAAKPGHVAPDVLQHLVLIYTSLTFVLGLLSALVVSRFPLTEQQHLQRLAELAEASARLNPLPGGQPDASDLEGV